MTHREEIMALPERDRLPYALELLDEILGGPEVGRIAWLAQNFDLTRTEARMFLALNGAAPRMVSKAFIRSLTFNEGDASSPNLERLYICKMRQKLAKAGGPHIELVWGQGYRISHPIDIGSLSDGPLKVRDMWTEQDDADLLQMVESGSSMSAIAYELDRTVPGIKHRLKLLRERAAA